MLGTLWCATRRGGGLKTPSPAVAPVGSLEPRGRLVAEPGAGDNQLSDMANGGTFVRRFVRRGRSTAPRRRRREMPLFGGVAGQFVVVRPRARPPARVYRVIPGQV